MHPDVLQALIYAGLGIFCFRMWFGYRRFPRHRNRDALPDRDRAIEDLRMEIRELVASQDERIEELHERLDFAERLLVSGRREVVAGEKERAHTPS